MGRFGKFMKGYEPIKEDFKLEAKQRLTKFIADNDEIELPFPATLSKGERAFVHLTALNMGLMSRSKQKEPNRYITVMKKTSKASPPCSSNVMQISESSLHTIDELIQKHPKTGQNFNVLQALKLDLNRQSSGDKSMGRLTFSIPQVPVYSFNESLLGFRSSLPIWEIKNEILAAIAKNQVIIITGETGSGKTTQVPQFLLEHANCFDEKCRIICTQPRRIAAVGVSKRVAEERNEVLGQTVGYQIHLESRIGPKTLLIYCTNGILLKTLLGGEKSLTAVSHIIIDEVHERDRYSDFLLICLRDLLPRHPHLKLVLMSATMDVNNFSNYFNGATCIFVKGRQFPVTTYFVEDVLKMTSFMSKEILRKSYELKCNKMSDYIQETSSDKPDNIVMDSILVNEVDKTLMDCFENGNEDSFAQLVQFMLSEGVPANYKHSSCEFNALMAAAKHGKLEYVEQFIHLGTDVHHKTSTGWSAYEYAQCFQHTAIADVLLNFKHPASAGETSLLDEDSQLSEAYEISQIDNDVDYDLLFALTQFIHTNRPPGSILMFLTGYDDIIEMTDRITNNLSSKTLDFKIFTLHSRMAMDSQCEVFRPLIKKRKIILSTNIGETSITIDDVVYVIDCGKMKETSYDAICGVTILRNNWISQACAKQRAGRAGRTSPGECYHLFSKKRFHLLMPTQTPEILRIPLHVLCLNARMLSQDLSIAEFLCLAMDRPSSVAINDSVEGLKAIGALDERENLTILGKHLVDFPVDPFYAKMLIYSVIFRCVDPILTIVTCLSHKGPFILSRSPKVISRQALAEESYSDHFVFLRAFQEWQNARVSRAERKFCNDCGISQAAMEIIANNRSQLLGQMRALGFIKNRPPGDIRDLNTNSNNWAIVKAVITAGLFPKIAKLEKKRICTEKERKVLFHPSSVLKTVSKEKKLNLPTKWLIFEELSRVHHISMMREVTLITEATIALIAGAELDCTVSDSFTNDDSNPNAIPTKVLKINNFIQFEDTADNIERIRKARNSISSMIIRRLRSPMKNPTATDEYIVHTVSQVLSLEETAAKLAKPNGVGTRPKPMLSESHSLTVKRFRKDTYKNEIPLSRQTPNSGESWRRPGWKASFVEEIDLTKPVDYFLKHAHGAANAGSSGFEKRLNNSFKEPGKLPYFGVQPGPSCQQMPIPNPALIPADSAGVFFDASIVKLKPDVPIMNNAVLRRQALPERSSRGACLSFGEARYFIIKVSAMKCIETSLNKKTWIFSPQTEKKLFKVFEEGFDVIMIFANQKLTCFQGLARLLGRPPLNSAVKFACPIEWITRIDVPFAHTKFLLNPYNESRQVQSYTDGQELDPAIGQNVCTVILNHSPVAPVQSEPAVVPLGRPIRGNLSCN